MTNLFIGVYLGYNFVIVLAYERFMGVFFEKRRTSLPLWFGAYLLSYVLPAIAFLQIGYPPLQAGITLFSLFVITLTYEARMMKRLIAVASILLCAAVAEVTVAVVLPNHPDFLAVGAGFNLEIYQFFIIGFLFYSMAILLRRFKHIKKNTITSPVLLISSIVTPVVSIIAFVVVAIYMSQVPALIITVIILVINILFFLFQDHLSAIYEERLQSALHAQEREYYFSQCQLMQQSAEQVKSMRHDMKLHLATLKEFSIGNKKAEDYLNRLLGDIDKGEVYSDTGNIAVDSIINFKLKDAVEKNIQTDVDVFVPPTLNIEVADIVTILGNLLDNALEAMEKVEDKQIRLNITSNKGNVLMKIENTFDGVVQYADDKGGASKTILTRKDGDQHGYGLKNILKSVEKYNGHMEIGHEDGVFSVGILLYV